MLFENENLSYVLTLTNSRLSIENSNRLDQYKTTWYLKSDFLVYKWSTLLDQLKVVTLKCCQFAPGLAVMF